MTLKLAPVSNSAGLVFLVVAAALIGTHSKGREGNRGSCEPGDGCSTTEREPLSHGGERSTAAVSFEKAVQASPENPNAWNNLGLALRKIGRKEEAVRAYRRAITMKPDFALVHKNLGIVLEQMGRKSEAAQAYLKYAELSPSSADARTAKEKAELLTGAGKERGAER